jgi:uncharacterized RDD family membrane protein YckC
MDTLRIAAADGVEIRLRPAGAARRCFAAAIDLLLITGTTTLIALACAAAPEALRALIVPTAGFLLLWGYHVWFEVRNAGVSPGKRVCGLRVVDADGLPITLPQAMVRSVLRLLDLAPLAGGVGLTAILLDRHGRRLGDLVAGTVVIHEPPPPALPLALLAERRHNTLDTPALRRRVAARIGLAERELLVAFVLRADGLEERARLDLAESLGARLRRELDLPEEAAHLSGENLVRAVLPLCFAGIRPAG